MRWPSCVAPFTASLVGFGCALVGDYDFEGLRPPSAPDHGDASIDSESSDASPTSDNEDAPAADANDASTADVPTCVPTTCEELGAECGIIADGCGAQRDCGSCRTGVCGGGGRNKCGVDPCSPKTCAELGASCGEISYGCGGTVHCGNWCRPKHAAAALSPRNAAARRGPVLRGARNAARFPTAAVKCSTAGLVPMAHRAARMAGPTAADACPPLAKPKTSIAGPFPKNAEAFSTARLACRRRFAGEVARGDVAKRLAGPRPARISELNAERFPISAAS